MVDTASIKEHMEVVGADGVKVGTVDHVEGGRIKLTKDSSGQGQHSGHHHYLSLGLVAAVEGNRIRLSANADSSILLEEEQGGGALNAAPPVPGSAPAPVPAANVEIRAEAPEKRVWNWNRLSIGAATLGVAAVAGAALLNRRNKADEDEDDFQLRLETDETVRLISSSKVEGTAVVGRDGETLGHITSFMVDKYTGRVAYAIMTFGGTMGFGGAYFPLPWPLLDYDVAKDGYALDITKEQMAQAPRFEANKEPDFTPEYRRTVIAHYRPSSASGV